MTRLARWLRALLAWALYWAGDAVCRLHKLFPDDWRIHRPIYRAYNFLMTRSSDVQGSGRGPWEPVK